MRVWVRSAVAVAGLVAYLGIFGAGMLLSSEPYRERLSARAAAFAVDDAGFAGTAVPDLVAAPGALIGDFVAALVLFTPINVAFLTLLAGLVGGCASHITFHRARPAAGDDERSLFRSESPAASMLRSFAVYLAYLAAIFVVSDDPFAAPSQAQYVRIAGTLSLLAFVVGYDPTRFTAIFDFASPRRAGRR
jgi:hypothetical protein